MSVRLKPWDAGFEIYDAQIVPAICLGLLNAVNSPLQRQRCAVLQGNLPSGQLAFAGAKIGLQSHWHKVAPLAMLHQQQGRMLQGFLQPVAQISIASGAKQNFMLQGRRQLLYNPAHDGLYLRRIQRLPGNLLLQQIAAELLDGGVIKLSYIYRLHFV